MMADLFARQTNVVRRDAVISLSGKPLLQARQKGVVLIIALIVLVAMTLAGIALIRSVDTGNMVAGNLAFKQGATSAGDAGTEAAIAWLNSVAGTTASYTDQVTAGYYATSQETLDFTGNGTGARALVDWDGNGCSGASPAPSACITPAVATVSPGANNTVTYIIHRLCFNQTSPNDTSNNCINYQSSGGTSPGKDDVRYGTGRLASAPTEYYRITSRVKGPKNTVSYVQTVIHY